MATDTTSDLAGTIAAVDDCGTIVIVHLRTEQGSVEPVYFERLPFSAMLVCERCERPEDLIGRPATFDGQTFFFDD